MVSRLPVSLIPEEEGFCTPTPLSPTTAKEESPPPAPHRSHTVRSLEKDPSKEEWNANEEEEEEDEVVVPISKEIEDGPDTALGSNKDESTLTLDELMKTKTLKDLKDACVALGLSDKGNKATIAQRLVDSSSKN